MKANVLILALLLAQTAPAQQPLPVTDIVITRLGHEVTVQFTAASLRTNPCRNCAVVFTPRLFGGGHQLTLPSAEVVGRGRERRERQERLLARDTTPQDIRFRAGEVIGYSYTLPYRPWMERLGLEITQSTRKCGGNIPLEITVAEADLYTPPTPVLSPVFYVPTLIERDVREEMGTKQLTVLFAVGSSRLDPEFSGNAERLDAIAAMICTLRDDPLVVFRRIELTGAASPEGAAQYNTRLGMARAEALHSYLLTHIPELKPEDFSLHNLAADWMELHADIAASAIPLRDDLLEILDRTPEKERIEKIKALDRGQTYARIAETYYPELRRACYATVLYDRLGDPACDALTLAGRHIRRGEYCVALGLLEPFADDPRTYNALGVCMMMLRREDQAREWFRKALASGDATAARNLAQIAGK